MQLREFLNKNSALVTIAAVVVMLCSLGFIIMRTTSTGPNRGPVDVYYYDTGTGDLFNAMSNEVPPIKAPSEKAGVRAFVFSCGQCGDKAQEFIGWMEMYTPDAKRLMTNPPTGEEGMDSFEIMEQGHLVSIDGQQWVSANSEAGFTMQDTVQAKCGDQPPTPCYPGR